MSGALDGTGLRISMYQRMPQLPTMNTVSQRIPRLLIPEAIIRGECESYPTDPKTIEGQFRKFRYPDAGYAPVRMYYKYGGSHFGTMNDTNRFVKMYSSPNLEFLVNQSICSRGSRIRGFLLPASPTLNGGTSGNRQFRGYSQHQFMQWNHR
jgi:trimethylamine-N-oxide reductase (cytochrome c)